MLFLKSPEGLVWLKPEAIEMVKFGEGDAVVFTAHGSVKVDLSVNQQALARLTQEATSAMLVGESEDITRAEDHPF